MSLANLSVAYEGLRIGKRMADDQLLDLQELVYAWFLMGHQGARDFLVEIAQMYREEHVDSASNTFDLNTLPTGTLAMDRFIKISAEGARLPREAAEWAAVLDTATQLMWTVAETDEMPWADAQKVPATLSAGGF